MYGVQDGTQQTWQGRAFHPRASALVCTFWHLIHAREEHAIVRINKINRCFKSRAMYKHISLLISEHSLHSCLPGPQMSSSLPMAQELQPTLSPLYTFTPLGRTSSSIHVLKFLGTLRKGQAVQWIERLAGSVILTANCSEHD